MDIMSEKNLVDSELKILKLATNLDKIGNNSNGNHQYKNLMVNIRNE